MPMFPIGICEVKFMRFEAGLSIFLNIFLQSYYIILAHNFHFQIIFCHGRQKIKPEDFLHI